MASKHTRLSQPQLALLAELAESGGLHIRRHSRSARIAEALARRGLARIDEPDYSSDAMDHWVSAVPSIAWDGP